MSFEQLLDELETMNKALPSDDTSEDDNKIQAAAADGEQDSDEKNEENEAVDGDDDYSDDESDDTGMSKSFQFTLESGEVVEAVDGGALVKALQARIDKNEDTLTKALGTAVTLIKSQGDMIKSLQGKVDKLARQGSGRKAVVSIVEKQSSTMAKSVKEEGMSVNEFMAKALVAQSEGRITGLDVSRAESYMNKGMPVPEDIVARVVN